MRDWFSLRSEKATLPGHKLISVGSICAASSSSGHRDSTELQNLVNGHRGSDFVFHTQEEESPFVTLDMMTIKNFDKVIVYNRIFCSERASDHRLSISCDGIDWQVIHEQSNYNFGGIDGNPLVVECANTTARYIKFALICSGILHLNSIEAWQCASD